MAGERRPVERGLAIAVDEVRIGPGEGEQLLDHAREAVEGGEAQRRPSERILRIGVRVAPQRRHDALMAALRCQVQRGAVVLGARVDVDLRLRDELGDDVGVVSRRRDHQHGPPVVVVAIVDVG